MDAALSHGWASLFTFKRKVRTQAATSAVIRFLNNLPSIYFERSNPLKG
jgi:hypothetical protein